MLTNTGVLKALLRKTVSYSISCRARAAEVFRRISGRILFRRPFRGPGEILWTAPTDLLATQYTLGQCRRMDIILRLMAAEEFGDSRSFGTALYEKYREKRPAPEKSERVFRELLLSMRRHGFKVELPIVVDQHGAIIDGAHRLACAIILDIPQVPVRLVSRRSHSFYEVRLEWFELHGFSGDEIATISKAEVAYRSRLAACDQVERNF